REKHLAIVRHFLVSALGAAGRREFQGRKGLTRLFVGDIYSGRRTDIRLGQVQGKGTSVPDNAAQLNFSAEKSRQLAADGQTQSGSAIFAARARIRLLERFEYYPLLFPRYADSRVAHFEGDNGSRAAQNLMIRAPSTAGRRNAKPDRSLFCELERIGQEILKNLLQALRVRDHAAHQFRARLNLKAQAAMFGL